VLSADLTQIGLVSVDRVPYGRCDALAIRHGRIGLRSKAGAGLAQAGLGSAFDAAQLAIWNMLLRSAGITHRVRFNFNDGPARMLVEPCLGITGREVRMESMGTDQQAGGQGDILLQRRLESAD